MSTWQLQDAKARLSELIETAKTEGPQTITQRGVESVVVVPAEDWKRMGLWRSHAQPSAPQMPAKHLTNEELLAFLQSAPDFEIPDRHAERLKRRHRRSA